MRVVCMSDLHGRLPELPACDLVAIAGDLAPDIERVGWDPDLMKLGQHEWFDAEWRAWEQTWTASRGLCTPGNHDWWHYLPAGLKTEVLIDNGVTIDGKTFWATPWVSFCGNWNHQMARDRRREMFDLMPYKLDLLIMHGPAHGVGDATYGGEAAGCPEMRAVIQQKQPKHVIFGHIHEGQRYGREFRLGGSKLYNVAMWGNTWEPLVLDI